MEKNICKECGRIKKESGKRNKEGELPYQISLEISKENIKAIRKGNKLYWFIKDKKKLGYCEIIVEKAKEVKPNS